jgi:GT2 family glycosyltransferase
MNPDGSKQIEYYFKFPNLFFSFYHNIVLRPLLTKTFLKNLIISQPKNVPFEVDQLPGAAILTSKATYEITNGLDEDYKFLFEDVDWCLKVKKKKPGKLMVIPSSKIIHLGGASWKKWREKDSFAFYKQYFSSFFTFVRKHQRSKTLLYKILLTDSFADNIFIHLIRGKLKKAKVQLKLIFFIWK